MGIQREMRGSGLAILALAIVGCDPKPGNPFVVTDTPEIRAKIDRICSDADTDPNMVPSLDPEVYVSCGWRGMRIELTFDEKTKAATHLMAILDGDPDKTRQRIERVVLPIVNDDMRHVIEKYVLADLGTNKEIRVARKGKGALTYRYDSHPLPNDDSPTTNRNITFVRIEIGRY